MPWTFLRPWRRHSCLSACELMRQQRSQGLSYDDRPLLALSVPGTEGPCPTLSLLLNIFAGQGDMASPYWLTSHLPGRGRGPGSWVSRSVSQTHALWLSYAGPTFLFQFRGEEISETFSCSLHTDLYAHLELPQPTYRCTILAWMSRMVQPRQPGAADLRLTPQHMNINNKCLLIEASGLFYSSS